MAIQGITPFLWFDRQVEQAARLYELSNTEIRIGVQALQAAARG